MEDVAGPVRKIEFFDPVQEFPQFLSTVDVWMVDVNPQQPVASVCKNHIKEWRSGDIAEVNRGPQG